ncbi:LysR family transcriptional regulator [Variovorax sp. LT1R16]|uniref:LysR family transcriptional regulator n=1 Tax=Variovorax sp. LT1R16 TaxID=3443728 RepID=UPI003F446D3E
MVDTSSLSTRFTLHQLEAFVWTARLGTVHAAARQLHLSQPAISHRIRDLEEELGIQLFERQSQRLLVTELGRNVLVYAERVLASAQDMARLDLRRTITGLVRMGVDESCAIIGMPQILKDIKDSYPALRVDLTVGGGALLLQKINSHELDMALHTGQSSQPDVTSQFIGLTQHQWVAAHDLMMPEEEFLPAHALNHRIVCNAPPSTLHESASRWLASDGYALEEYSSCNSLSLMVALVASGHAIAMLPASITRQQVAEKSLQVLHAKPVVPNVPYYFSYLAHHRSDTTARILDIVLRNLQDTGFFHADEVCKVP